MSLYERIYDERNLEESYKRTQRGKRKYRKEAICFSMAKEKKLKKLRKELEEKRYRPGGYIAFYVYEPKKRLVHARISGIKSFNSLYILYFREFISWYSSKILTPA